MLKSYFKTAWRNLKGAKFYSLVNISGLAVGLATGIMLLLWVQHERSYDKMHQQYSNIYQFSAHLTANGSDMTWTKVPGPLSIMAKSIPAVKSITRITEEWDQNLSTNDHSKAMDGNHIAYVDTSFFTLFDFQLLAGSPSDLFQNSNSVFITQTTAQKLFGKSNPVGQVIGFKGPMRFTVTGVLADFPETSTLQFDALFPMDFYAQQFTASGGNYSWKTIDSDLGSYAFNTFVLLAPNADPQQVAQAFSSVYKTARKGDSKTQFQLQNLADIHLIGADGNASALQMVQIFMLVAIALLLIASINYINLSTARSLFRAKEVSVRKIIGANKGQLFFQFISETTLLFCIATIIAFGLIYLFMPLYNELSGKTLRFALFSASVWKVIGGATVGTLLLSSIYPALLLTSFKPIAAIKGKVTSNMGITIFRKTLVVFQFTVSVILMISTFVISNQMAFIRNKNLGYDKSYVFSVPLVQEVADHLDAIKADLSKQQGILQVASSDIYNISSINNTTSDLEWMGKPANSTLMITGASIDENFIPTMKMQFLEGQNFSGTPADSGYYILNEKAVHEMGLKPPYVGQEISLHEQKGTIIGVVKDFNFQSLKTAITPLIFYTWSNRNILHVRTTGKDAQKAITAVAEQHKRYGGNTPYSYYFVDKQFEALYASDQRTGTLFNLFSAIVLFISCLGLFGLATYTAQVRTKEIGVRKVLGATVMHILQMLSQDFVKLIILAILIASPIAWWAMNNWLDDFVFRIEIKWWMFVWVALMAIAIALLTISFQAVKAALANPIKSLRDE
ncbi:ABC transporter permease [Olivibacter ginsenosidimutans]